MSPSPPTQASDLDMLFAPRSVALIGASADPQSISARPLRLLKQHGYAGGLYPVNPKYTELMGLTVYPSIGSVPPRVDLALVVVPAASVAAVLEECAAAGVGCAVVITSGFAESGADGRRLQAQIAEVVARTGMRVCGPNSEGLYNPASRLCATFSPAVDPEHGYVPSEPGPIAIVSQSGGLAFALLNHAEDRGLAVGATISTGNEVDLTWADYADYLLDQPTTRVVLGFVESFRRPARLVEVARKAARLQKPLVIAKIGRTEAGRRAAASHTASLVGTDAAYSAAFRQLGILRVDDVDEMLDLAAYFSAGRLPGGRRTAVLTASGGAGAWLADACAMRGLELPEPDAEVQARIRSFIPSYGSAANPVDITAQAVFGGGFERALRLLVGSGSFDSVLAVASLVREERFFETLGDVREAIGETPTAVAYYSYTRASPAVVRALAGAGIPCFPTPGRAARAVSAAAEYAAFQRGSADIAILRNVQHDTPSRIWPAPIGPLSEHGARAYLAPLEIASPPDALAHSAAEAVASFAALGEQPVALKVQSAGLAHKSQIGGVRLGVRSPEDVRAGYAAIVQAVGDIAIEGVLVQRMAPVGIEAFVGVRLEPLLGPVVVVGFGGVDVEALGDVAMRLAPVTVAEALAMIGELSRSDRLGEAGSDVDALAAAVVRVSDLAIRLPPSISSVEINPLLVLPRGEGVLMLDAAIELEGETTA